MARFDLFDFSGNPEIAPNYFELVSSSNIDYVVQRVTEILRECFPTRPPMIVSKQNVRVVMEAIYQSRPEHPEIMIQKTINMMAGQIKDDIVSAEKLTSYNPWIQTRPEEEGMSAVPSNIKLDHRGDRPFEFVVRR
jgi:hypothetical protein